MLFQTPGIRRGDGWLCIKGHDDRTPLRRTPTQSAPIPERGQVSVDTGLAFASDRNQLLQANLRRLQLSPGQATQLHPGMKDARRDIAVKDQRSRDKGAARREQGTRHALFLAQMFYFEKGVTLLLGQIHPMGEAGYSNGVGAEVSSCS